MNSARPNPGASTASPSRRARVLQNVPQPGFLLRRPAAPSAAARDPPGRGGGGRLPPPRSDTRPRHAREGGRPARPAERRPRAGSRGGGLGLPPAWRDHHRHRERGARRAGSGPAPPGVPAAAAATPPVRASRPGNAPRTFPVAPRSRPGTGPPEGCSRRSPAERTQLPRHRGEGQRPGPARSPLGSLPPLPSSVVPAVASPAASPRRARRPGPAPETRQDGDGDGDASRPVPLRPVPAPLPPPARRIRFPSEPRGPRLPMSFRVGGLNFCCCCCRRLLTAGGEGGRETAPRAGSMRRCWQAGRR